MKIDIISGFLGAGKTTLIQRLLKGRIASEKVVLIENEFGEISVDTDFLKDTKVEIQELSQGCICCSLVGDFSKALKEIVDRFYPDRIIIEPSGVGKLSDVTKAVVSSGFARELNSLVCLVDVTKAKMYMKNFGEFYNDQIETASTIILSRTQTMKQDRLEKAVSLIQEKNKKGAQIITTPWDQLTGTQILQVIEKSSNLEQELLKELEEHRHEEHHHEHHHHEDHEHHDHHDHEEECSCGCHHHHHADEVFTSWGKETPAKYSKEELADILHKLSEETEYGMILRAKGMLPTQDGEWMYFDLVPGEYEIRTGSPDYTGRICVIGSQLQEEKLMELFHLA